MLGGTKAFRENVMAHEDQWKWWSSTDSGAHTVNSVPWAALTVIHPADSFETARPDKGINIRLRCLWKSNRNILKEALVTPVKLTVNDKVVEGRYIEEKDRRGRITDSYRSEESREGKEGVSKGK